MSKNLIKALKQEKLLQLEELKDEANNYQSQLKELVKKVKAAQKDYAAAISLLERVNAVDNEVLEFAAKYCKEAKILRSKMSLVQASQLLNSRNKKLSYQIDLTPIGLNGVLEVSKTIGRFAFNKSFCVRLKIKDKKGS